MKRKNQKDSMEKSTASTKKQGNVILLNKDKVDMIEKAVSIEKSKNLALNKETISSSIENESLGANNITSGVIDRKNFQHRWSAAYDAEKPWVAINLGKKTKFNEVVIEWERRNVTSYEIQGSNDKNNWTIIKRLERPEELRQAIGLEDQYYKYLKLQVDTYEEDGASGEIPWLNVSIYELEVYYNKNIGSPKEIINDENRVKKVTSEILKDEVCRANQDKKLNGVVERVSKDKTEKEIKGVIIKDKANKREKDRVVVNEKAKQKKDYKRNKGKIAEKKVRLERACVGGKSPPYL